MPKEATYLALCLQSSAKTFYLLARTDILLVVSMYGKAPGWGSCTQMSMPFVPSRGPDSEKFNSMKNGQAKQVRKS